MNVLSDFIARVEDMEKKRNIAGDKITEKEKSPEKAKKAVRTSRVKSAGECCEDKEKGEYEGETS